MEKTIEPTVNNVNYEEEQLSNIFNHQRQFFDSKATFPYEFRIKQLKKLKAAIRSYEKQIFAALKADLNKHEFESYGTEVGIVYEEINYTIKNLKKWMKPQWKYSPIAMFPSSSYIYKDPLGCVFIVAPWNYPFQLLIAPLVGAIAGGNCAILKPSEFTPEITYVMRTIIKETFDENYVAIVEGEGQTTVPYLLKKHRFDLVFFTGSIPVGKNIAELAAPKLTPVILELGGKSPCIVDKDVDMHHAAKRIVWGKFTNAGQTCVAPDYLLVHNSRKDEFISLLKKYILEFYGEDAKNSDFGRIINEKRFNTLESYLSDGKIIAGGQTDAASKFIAPTLLDSPSLDSAVMKDEIFGPILPVYGYNEYEETIEFIKRHPYPLALYLFTNSDTVRERYLKEVTFGGGCINNTLMHLCNPKIPFGGVGYSGMGNYHGKYSFDTFTHSKAVVKSGTWFDPGLLYAPFKEKIKIARMFLKY
ncbi:aldehyde dehydrogenase [Solitalea koreensis]|uniref:Aldehyde dehydrogenase n=1 Tax=Solitalea koreensis TaxID=543615 RepID=A0A521D043_9SPHI|nr:aldehyde dehydrogenase [Solitalea koreensis]SMO65022.1 aldehyde dehydrogenase (NAD+) [Solitalea koreensis]